MHLFKIYQINKTKTFATYFVEKNFLTAGGNKTRTFIAIKQQHNYRAHLIEMQNGTLLYRFSDSDQAFREWRYAFHVLPATRSMWSDQFRDSKGHFSSVGESHTWNTSVPSFCVQKGKGLIGTDFLTSVSHLPFFRCAARFTLCALLCFNNGNAFCSFCSHVFAWMFLRLSVLSV